jgi:hypothetical protein
MQVLGVEPLWFFADKNALYTGSFAVPAGWQYTPGPPTTRHRGV